MKTCQIHSRSGDQRRQPSQEVQGVENHLGCTIPIRGFQLIPNLAVAGE